MSTPDGGAAAITADLRARLRKRVVGAGPMPGAVLAEEVGWNGVPGEGRRADAIAVTFTSASGRRLIGYEIKATRGDWLRELRDPTKADAWGDSCHEWWVVAPAGIVKDDEVPGDWGLLVTRGPGLTVARAATPRTGVKPEWDVLRSVFARLDTQHRAEIAALSAKVRAKVLAEVEERERRRRADDQEHGYTAQAKYERLLAALGLKEAGAEWVYGDREVDAATLREFGDAAWDLQQIREIAGRVSHHLDTLDRSMGYVADLRTGVHALQRHVNSTLENS